MADYAFRTLEQRKRIETMWNDGAAPKKIAEEMQVSETVVYTELRRGRDGTRLEDRRLRYNAALAQQIMAQSLESRGRKAGKAACGPAKA